MFSLPQGQRVAADHYHSLAATFDPTSYDPADLARRASAAGMRYVVFTARHHSGFAMFDTATTDHKVANSPHDQPSGRDLVRETVEAFRAEGIRIGLYLSLSNWHHPDYPAWTDELRPYRFGASPPMPTEEQAARFREDLTTEVTELLTDYGRIDVLWFDGAWERPQTWWRAEEIGALARRLQPDILVNDRLPGAGGYATPEQIVPARAPAGRWETCMTMNESWGWNPDDTAYKSKRSIVVALCKTVARGGNLLLNVSPTGTGELPGEQVERLDALTAWMDRHADAVHDTTAGLEPWQFYGPSTRRGDVVHLFLVMRPEESVSVRGLPVRRVRRVSVLGTGRELELSTRTGILDSLLPDPEGEVTMQLDATDLDDLVTVLRMEIDPPPDPPVIGE